MIIRNVRKILMNEAEGTARRAKWKKVAKPPPPNSHFMVFNKNWALPGMSVPLLNAACLGNRPTGFGS